SSDRGGQFDLYVKASSGTGDDELLLESTYPKYPTDWSSDGRYLIYTTLTASTRSDVWVLPLFGDRVPFPYLQSPFREGDARFSPDGRWVAYTSDETGTYEVYVQSFPIGAGKWQISRGGGGLPKWRADGKELLYVNNGTLMSVEVTGSPAAFV